MSEPEMPNRMERAAERERTITTFGVQGLFAPGVPAGGFAAWSGEEAQGAAVEE